MIERERTTLYIDGAWRQPVDGRVIDVVNPTTEEPMGRAALAGPTDVDRAVRAAHEAALGPWPRLDPGERADVLRRAAEILDRRSGEIADLIVEEVGSPRAMAELQPWMARAFLDWHAEQAATYPWEEERQGVMGPMLVRRQPAGVVGAIVPWNFPLLLAFPKLAPALLTGCTVVLKAPEETPLSVAVIADVFDEAQLPAGVLNVIAADRVTSEELVRHPLVDKVSFTGSTRAGRRVAAVCGEGLKRCTLELGGKSAAILLPDADLGAVVPALVPSTMTNNGQTCVNQTRILAHRDRYDDVVDAVCAEVGALRVGDPADPDVAVGPLVSAAQRERVEGLIARGRADGARVALGGGRPDVDRGWFVEPTVFADVDNGSEIGQEEIFGPVVCVIAYDDEDHAVALANATRYGLSGSVWGDDQERAKDIARRVRSGNVAVNQHTLDIAGPFGGFKDSGLGREYGPEGIAEYVELQSIPYRA